MGIPPSELNMHFGDVTQAQEWQKNRREVIVLWVSFRIF